MALTVGSATSSISIHALVKRATPGEHCRFCRGKISIHALVKRATAQFRKIWAPLYISIHALVKRATICETAKYCVKSISIHALVKRATFSAFNLLFFCQYFNPRPREEGDLRADRFRAAYGNFNPRPREEGDE